MSALLAPLALLPEGWARDVRVTLDGTRIARVETGAQARRGDEVLAGQALLPAMPNLHSHTFQRAMAGMTERRGASSDSFWTWRDLMYRFVAALEPEDVEAIAAQAFVEMLEAGFGSVAEFHYLHHQPDGTPYADPAELCHRVAAAAEATGIGMTLLPVLYSRGGAGAAPLTEGQRRFGGTLEGFLRLVDAARSGLPEGTRLGAAPHSLRATIPEELAALVEAVPEGPLHIHAAEQVREVEEVRAWLGRRPVEFLLEQDFFGPRWCVIHATHMNAAETDGLARSGATAGLCPITEANLGDGVFPAARFLDAGGAFGIGSDSNVRIAVAEELRTLEYGQRLTRQARNVLAGGSGSTGQRLYASGLAGGARALARDCGALAPGRLADLVALDRDGLVLGPLPDEAVLDGWIFAGGEGIVRTVWVAGQVVVREGRHPEREAVAHRYRRRMAEVMARL